jgi:hypothetical protein
VFYRNPIGSPAFSYEDKTTAFSLKDYIDQAMWYDAEEVMVERYEDIDGRKNTSTWKERMDSFQQSKSGAQPSAQWMSDDDLDPEAMEREDAEYNDPRYRNLDPLETLRAIANRFPGSGQFKREQRSRLGFSRELKLACMNLGNVTRLMLLPNYTNSMRTKLRGLEKAKFFVYLNYI